MKKIVFIVLFIFLNSARSIEIEKNLFKKHYQDNYQYLMCSHNVLSLIKKLQEAGLSLENSYVVHVRTISPQYISVKTYQSRIGFDEWSFHAFLIHEGLVFDMDYKDTPTMIPLKEYLEAMYYPLENELNQNLYYQMKKAIDYFEDDFDGTMNLEKNPLRSLNDEAPLFNLNTI